MARVREFQHISALDRQGVVDAFLAVIKQMDSITCPDLSELYDACEVSGAKLQEECYADRRQGVLVFAKMILDHANTATGCVTP